jgi:hypothetical protein
MPESEKILPGSSPLFFALNVLKRLGRVDERMPHPLSIILVIKNPELFYSPSPFMLFIIV